MNEIAAMRLARELRIQPEDVFAILDSGETNAGIVARRLRIQPEDVEYVRSAEESSKSNRLGLDDTDLPPATKSPCRECPWRRKSAPGHLGPIDAEGWTKTAHSDAPIACHLTLTHDDPSWDSPGLRQCAGAAQFRTNVFKSPRNPAVATADQRDDSEVFGTTEEFRTHHEGGSCGHDAG